MENIVVQYFFFLVDLHRKYFLIKINIDALCMAENKLFFLLKMKILSLF